MPSVGIRRRLIPAPSALASLTFLLAAAGCATSVAHRIEEKSALFANLPAHVQESLREGNIGVGYSPDLVYIALGSPTEKETRETSEGPVEVWIYRRYFGAMNPQTLPSYQNIRQEIANSQGVGSQPSTNPLAGRGRGNSINEHPAEHRDQHRERRYPLRPVLSRAGIRHPTRQSGRLRFGTD
ncbi:MAG: hypothetical protein RIS54_468 [Verrucomicrobiota bacterium]